MNETYVLDFVGTLTQNMLTPVLKNESKNDSTNDYYNNHNKMTPRQITPSQSTKMNDRSLSMPSSSQVDTRGYSRNVVSFSGSSNSGHSIVISKIPSSSPDHSASSISDSVTSSNSGNSNGGRNRSRSQTQNLQRERKKSRSRAVKGATNLAKEAKLLRRRLDSVLDAFEETAMSASQSQNTRIESLQAENRQLLAEIRELEIETFRQVSELDDSDELMIQMEERHFRLKKEAAALKDKCYSLAKEVVFLKKSLDAYEQTEKGQLEIENEKLESENESLKLELSAKDKTIRDLGNQLNRAKMKLMGENENNDDINRGVNTKIPRAGKGEPKIGKKKDDVNGKEGTAGERSLITPKGKHRRSPHSMTLRGSHKKRFQF
eukprot:jgi/Psemu1/328894/estExt_fgenesh1_pg.C_28570002